MASLNSVSRRRSIGLFLSAGFLVLAAIVAILIWQRPHGLNGSHRDSGTSREGPSERGISSSDPSPSPQARPVRPSTAPGRKEVSPFNQQSGALDPEWLARRGIAKERLGEVAGIVGRYRQLSVDLLLSRLVFAPGESGGETGQKVYHFSPLNSGSARPMDEMRAELRTVFGGSPGELMFRDLEFDTRFCGFWAGAGTAKFQPLNPEDGEVRWTIQAETTEPQGGSGKNGIEILGRGLQPLIDRFGTDFKGLY